MAAGDRRKTASRAIRRGDKEAAAATAGELFNIPVGTMSVVPPTAAEQVPSTTGGEPQPGPAEQGSTTTGGEPQPSAAEQGPDCTGGKPQPEGLSRGCAPAAEQGPSPTGGEPQSSAAKQGQGLSRGCAPAAEQGPSSTGGEPQSSAAKQGLSFTGPQPERLHSGCAPAAEQGPSNTGAHGVPRATPTTVVGREVTPSNKTWSSLFNSSSQPGRVNLHYEESVSVDGKFILNSTPEEIEEGAAHWRNSLVGYFIGRRPPFHVVKNRAEAMWKPTGAMEVLTLPSGFFIFRFGLAEDKNKILEGGPWFIQSRLLILKPWDTDTKLEKLDLSAIPVWVKIHNLPLHLWTPTLIGRIASWVGKPMYMDQLTAARSRVGFARVCIEISSQQDLPDQLQFSLNGTQDFSLTLEYDWKPPRCNHCRIFGHASVNYPLEQQKQKTAWVPKKKQEATVEATTIAPNETHNQNGNLGQEKSTEVTRSPDAVGTRSTGSHEVRPARRSASSTSEPRPSKFTLKEKGKFVIPQGSSTPPTMVTNSFQCLGADLELEGGTHPPDDPTASMGADASNPSTPFDV